MGSIKKRIGIIGLGAIGGYIMRAVNHSGVAEVDFVMTRTPDSANLEAVSAQRLSSLDGLPGRGVDLVIEAANPHLVQTSALQILDHADLVVFSLTSLADDAFRERIRAKCEATQHRLFIPHGAILGLDGIFDGRSLIEEVSITTTKHPRNLGLQTDASGTLFAGSARDACQAFPKNVNVHAAVALAGIGFDRTHSAIVADSSSDRMVHEIRVRGNGVAWDIRVASRPVGAVTGKYTPESGANTVRRILGGDYDITLA